MRHVLMILAVLAVVTTALAQEVPTNAGDATIFQKCRASNGLKDPDIWVFTAINTVYRGEEDNYRLSSTGRNSFTAFRTGFGSKMVLIIDRTDGKYVVVNVGKDNLYLFAKGKCNKGITPP